MNFHVLTLFPEMIVSGLSTSITGKAMEKGAISVNAVDIRDFSVDKHKKVDDYPYGGGAGLLMQAQPVCDAHKSVTAHISTDKPVRTIYLTPQGKTFNQRMAEEFAKESELIFLCGHYEGIDERALEEVVTDYVSLGDFVLTGGELAAMVMIDAIARLVPGVLHNDTSAVDESFSGYLLEYPQYTRPESYNGKKVPAELLTGNHKIIRKWRKEQAEIRTKERRPDLYKIYEEMLNCSKQLMKNKLHHMDMLQLIERGQAKLLYRDHKGILLYDRISKTCMMTVSTKEDAERILSEVFDKGQFPLEEVALFLSHQEFVNEIIVEKYGFSLISGCTQWVYTRKEALPTSKMDFRRLDESHLSFVAEHYTTLDEETLAERFSKGAMYGIFDEDKLCGFIGEHQEGSIGMLYVLPEYRGKGIGENLEKEMINQTLKNGLIPFGQVYDGNDKSLKMQEKLGLYPAKEKVWWFEK